MLPTRESRAVGGEHAVFVGGAAGWRHDAVGSEQNRTVEGFKLLALLPPSIAVVALQVGVLFKFGIVVCREHLAVGIDVDARVLALLQQLLDVVQIVSADEDTRTVAHSDVHFCDFGVAESGGVGFVEQGHCLHAPFAGLQRKGGELVGIVAGDKLSEGLQDKLVDIAINLTKAGGMLQIGGHTFETVHGEFFQRADILVAFSEDAHGLRFLIVLFASAVPFQNIKFRQLNTLLVGYAIFEHIADFQALVNAGVDALRVEIGVGNGAEQRVVHKSVDALAEVAIVVTATMLMVVGDNAKSFEDINQKVLCMSHLRGLSAHT